MFSAVRFVAAAAIVALFGGFLLAGVLTTQQSDEVFPATVTESPSPMTTEESLSGMATEEVEPGVFRVIDDGVRDLSSVDAMDIVAGHDGGLWFFDPDGFFRLGDEGDHRWDGRWMPPYEDDDARSDIEVAPDGTVWALVNRSDGPKHLRSFDGRKWMVRRKAPEGGSVIAVEVQPDGTVWAAWAKEGGKTKVARLEGEEWRVESSVDGALAVDSANPTGGPPTLSVAGADIWLSTGNPYRLYHRDDGGWREQDLPTGAWWVTEETGVRDVEAGPGGALLLETCESWGFGCHNGFAHYDGTDWEWWRADEARQVEGGGGVLPDGVVGITPDGSIWFGNEGGLVAFDGSTWTDYLTAMYVTGGAVAPDGLIWALAGERNESVKEMEAGRVGSVGLYVITPEAMAAKEAEVSEPPSVEESADSTKATTTTEELLSGMVTEEVEPGVFRVINDGVRDLAKANNTNIVAGHDGGLWLLRPQRFLRLGDDEWLAWPTKKPEVEDFEVGPDGTVWAMLDGEGLYSVDSGSDDWTPTTRDAPYSGPIEVTSDGTVWALWGDDPDDPDSLVFGYLGADGWQAVDEWPDGWPVMGWCSKSLLCAVLVSDRGDVWAVSGLPRDLQHFVDGAWRAYDGLDDSRGSTQDAAVGADGTLWGRSRTGFFRFDGTEWMTFEPPDWMPTDVRLRWGVFHVAPDGSLWVPVRPTEEVRSGVFRDVCDHGVVGVARFDGVTWDRYAPRLCVEAIDISADGAVWLLASEETLQTFDRESQEWAFADDLEWHLYVITPEAVAASE